LGLAVSLEQAIVFNSRSEPLTIITIPKLYLLPQMPAFDLAGIQRLDMMLWGSTADAEMQAHQKEEGRQAARLKPQPSMPST